MALYYCGLQLDNKSPILAYFQPGFGKTFLVILLAVFYKLLNQEPVIVCKNDGLRDVMSSVVKKIPDYIC